MTQLIPQRLCALCAQAHDVLHMTLAGRLWVCRSCLARDAAPPGAARRAGEPTWDETARALQRLETILHFTWLGVRVVAYGVLVLLAWGSPMWAAFLTGVLVADVAMRAVAAVFELRLHRFGLLLEVILFAVVGRIWWGLTGASLLPEDQEARAITMLGFLAVFSMRSSLFVWKLLHR